LEDDMFHVFQYVELQWGVESGWLVESKAPEFEELPAGCTRHPPIQLRCLELPDAACFMKGR